MRGTQAFPIPVPTAGLRTDAPPHLIPPNALASGNNMFVDLDGQLKPRMGYTPVNPVAPGLPPFGVSSVRIMGGLNFAQADQSRQTIIASIVGFFVNSGLGTWTALTGPNRTSSINQPVRIVPFFTGGVWHALSCDFSDQIADWPGTGTTYSVLGASPIVRDLMVLNERVVGLYTQEANVHFPRRVRWSSNLDQTTWGTNNFIDLSDQDDPIICGRPLGRTSAAVYGEKSIYLLSASPGDDANAFVEERVFAADGYPGPISAACVTVVGGLHYYMAHDGRIYTFDGIDPPTPISGPIDAALRSQVQLGVGDRFHCAYLPSLQYVIFFFAGEGQTDCNMAAAYNIPTGRWEPFWNFASDFISSSFSVTDLFQLTWNNDPYTWNSNPFTWNSTPSSQSLDIYLGTVAGNVMRFWSGNQDNTTPIAWEADGALISLGPNKLELLDRVEIYTPQSLNDEFYTVQFNGFGAPNRPATPIVSVGADLGDAQWLNQQIPPGPQQPANQTANYVQVSLFSNNAPDFAMGGGTLWMNVDERGDYGSQ